jgi:ubiquinone/menaquinone biosynthesis C-methylase UbiE
MDPVIKRDLDRLKLFKKYGYDIPRAREYIIAKSAFPKSARVLEVGTGRGHMATVLARKGFKLISIDLDKEAQEVAKIHLKAIGRARPAILRIMDAERLRYKDGSFDHVVSVNFMHHARRPARCLREMIRVAAKTLVVADINKRGERIMERVHRLDGHSHPASKISFKEMEVLMKDAGMKVRAYRDACQTVLVAKKGDVR